MQNINPLGTAKNCDLKTQKICFSIAGKSVLFLNAEFWLLNCEFAKRLTAFLKINFSNHTF